MNGPAADTEETDGEEHVLRCYGRQSDYHPDIARASKGDYCTRHKCVICGKKTSTYCPRSGCKLKHKREPSVCSSGKRRCLGKQVRKQAIAEAIAEETATVAGRSKKRHLAG